MQAVLYFFIKFMKVMNGRVIFHSQLFFWGKLSLYFQQNYSENAKETRGAYQNWKMWRKVHNSENTKHVICKCIILLL